MLTFEEFKQKMLDIYTENCNDTEILHMEMDAAMCNLLIDLGYREGVEIFQGVPKWYA